MILRLNPDGTAPRDNPFYKVGAERGGQVGANLKKIYAYGLRNCFGMAFDPFSGDLWEQENGDDSFSEINRVEPGFNSGWMQVMGPLERVAQFKAIETTAGPTRPTRSAPAATTASSRSAGTRSTSPTTPREAYDRLFKLPGSQFSATRRWPGSTRSPRAASTSSPTRELGKDYKGDLFVGSARGPARRQHVPPADRRTTARRSTSRRQAPA